MLDFSARASPSLRNPTSFCYKSLLFCELLQVAIAICVDFPYNYLKGLPNSGYDKEVFNEKEYDWIGRILDLARETKADGLKFGLIFNGEQGDVIYWRA